MTKELAVTHGTVAVRSTEYSPEQWAILRRLVKLRPGQVVPHQEEMTLMVQEAAHLDLDPFAGECYFINFGDGWICYPHWSGLVKTAEATGEYEGHEGPFYSDDGERWVQAWAPDAAPKFCKVRVFRTGHRPTEVVVRYSRVATGSPNWKKDPEAQLGKAALRLAIRRAFPREADRPLSGAQLKALHTLASMEGLGGEENRPARLAAVSEILGKPVESFKDLSVAEATEIYDAWAGEPEDERMTAEEAAAEAERTFDPQAVQEAIKAAGRARRAGDPWEMRTEEGGGSSGEVEPPARSSTIPAESPRSLAAPRQESLEPDGRSEARIALDDVLAKARLLRKSAVAIATMREYLVGLGPDFARVPEARALVKLNSEQLLTLAGKIEERLP